ncbi:alpha/beta fold hydrolase [Haladaptatus salinisoli]|uniref:alpha/beta fold hydrolase n=1 Tax=Haladaptatus salinisoli TaxID=2884876 RepID=UPI001D09EBE4|nr:alpha/beta hydrolase [Haladaptatus salinisoli]
MTELAHHEAVVDGVRLHYVEAGDGPLVVLLHGFPEFWYSWREQIPALAEAGFRVVAPDMRGYNASEKPRGVERYRTDELVGDAAALVDRFGEESASVVGHDWGGVVAWETAIRRPERVDRLAVLNAPHPGRYREAIRSPEQLLRSWYALFFQLPKVPELLLSARDYAGIEGMLRGSAESPDAFTEEDIRRYVEAAARPGALTAALDYYRAAFRENAPEELRARLGGTRRSFDVRAPTLLIWGERDPALSVELTEGLERWVPDLRVERLPDAGHAVQNDAPDRVNELLVEFLRE